MPLDPARAKSLFLAASDIPIGDERAAFLDRECGGDAELRDRVNALLQAHDAAPLDPEQADHATVSHVPNRSPSPIAFDDRTADIGAILSERYKLLELIGEGGMGSVWVAQQTEPVKRKVAVKLIKAGMDSKAVLARFEAERQALAVMDHPNIAKILDGGLTGTDGNSGRPFFVMELVKGVPITEYCDANKLTPKQRLELFVPVCQAIQHAHQKGIIHRDIKPSNVLIALYDDKPVPKVIDFGIAKATGGSLTEHTIETAFGGVVGTPQYMSPEQASLNNLDIDTRSDIYSLGILLYELLAGSPPFDRKELEKRGVLEILRVVREEEPPRPSVKLSTSDARASIAAVRGSEPEKLSLMMKGEIDWIVMKALEKDRIRRYDSANGLAADVRRYLNGDAVEACPPTLGYRLRKAYGRNRVAVRVVSAFVCLAFGAAAMGAYLAVQARRAEAIARTNEQEAQEQRLEAERNKDAWLKVSEIHLEAAVDAEIRAASARLDADLLEYKSDARVGLLRLARPLKDSVTFPAIGPNFRGTNFVTFTGPEFVNLRAFQTAAVIAAGQEFVPLVPPLQAASPGFHNSYGNSQRISPDYRRYLGGSERHGLELRTLPDSTLIGTLREGTERVVEFGFSPDGRTAFTQDTDSVVRFWNTDGTLRARTPLRPERFVYPPGLSIIDLGWARIGNPLLVADGVALLRSEQRVGVKPGHESDLRGKPGPHGPADLYSTRTGQFIRRLGRPGDTLSDFKLVANGRWLVYYDLLLGGADQVVESTIVVVSTDDGRELARLSTLGPAPRFTAAVSPTGKWILTTPEGDDTAKHIPDAVRLWRSADWTRVEDAALVETLTRIKTVIHPAFVTDDVLSLYRPDGFDSGTGIVRLGRPGLRARDADLGTGTPDFSPVVGELGGSLLRCGRVLTDAQTFKRLKTPEGRKYAPELAKLAPDGRFWQSLDTATEKDLPYFLESRYFPGLGQVGVRNYYESDEPPYLHDNTELRILPDPKRLDVKADLLQLWAQVVTGGELGPDDHFEPWDQPTWAAKQRELAAAKPPYPDFPFPGLATVPNVWHLVRAKQLRLGPERDRHMDEWQRWTRHSRPDFGPDSWRTPGPSAEPTPPPSVK